MAPRSKAFGIEVWFSAKLIDSLSHPVRMLLLIRGMLQKLRFDGFRVDDRGGEIMTFVTQYAYYLGRQHIIEHFDDTLAIRLVTVRNCALVHVLASAFTDPLDIGHKFTHHDSPI